MFSVFPSLLLWHTVKCIVPYKQWNVDFKPFRIKHPLHGCSLLQVMGLLTEDASCSRLFLYVGCIL